jgi:hypothetical protein
MGTVYMTGGVYVWPQSMEFRVYDKSSGVDELISSTDTIALSVNMYHVGHFEQRKVDSVRIDPEGVCFDRIYTT